jgi:2-dehydropantoate 2-reductase
MRILVFGAGAVGSVLGGFLAKAGHDVTLLGRAWHLDVVRAQGLAISGLWGEHRVTALTTATSLEEVPDPASCDWVFVCVKAHQTAEAARALPRALGLRTLVCAFQNGLGNYEALTQAVAPSRVALGRIIFGVELTPGHVRVTVCADEVLVGAPDRAFPREQVAALVAALQESGIPVRATATILHVLWAKVLYNCALNGLSTLLEVPYGKLLDCPHARRLMSEIIEEAYRVASAHRIQLEPSTAEAYRELLFKRLIPDTAAHRSSMLHDVAAGKPSEIESLNGALVRLGRQANVPVPANALITRLVHAKEAFVRG